MRRAYEYGTAQADTDLAAVARIGAEAFGSSVEHTTRWVEENAAGVRVVRRDGVVAGSLLLVPMGQFFGGKRVSMTGVAGVGVTPGERGHGAASALLSGSLRELDQGGVALSALYPSTYSLYRRAGYELAGGQYRVRVPAHRLSVVDRSLEVAAVRGQSDLEAVAHLYRAQATHRPGWLDRSEYIWKRVTQGWGSGVVVYGYVVVAGDELEGYVFLTQEQVAGHGYRVRVHDLVAASPRAGRRLLGLLADMRAQASEVVWCGGVDEPLLGLLPERGYEVALAEPWMLRVVNVARAVDERGYPAGVSARLELEVTDELLGEHSGRYVVEVQDGSCQVHRGGRGRLRLSVRALASLYSGHHSPYQLAAVGALEGTADQLASAAALFAGPAPSMRDYF